MTCCLELIIKLENKKAAMLVAISFGWFYRLNDCDANDKFPGNKSGDSKAFKKFKH